MRYIDSFGNEVLATDPDRLVWYGPACGWWTDDALKPLDSGFHGCPRCRSPLITFDWREWMLHVEEKAGANSAFCSFVSENKERCFKTEGGLILAFESQVGGG